MFIMKDNLLVQTELFGGETIDIDRMVEEAEQLRGAPGNTILNRRKGYPKTEKPAGRVVKPSFGGKIEPRQTKLFDDGQDQFRCGR
jgi:hypothetical protein